MKLTKDEIDVIICALEDINHLWGMTPEERELYEKITREENKND